MEEKIYFIVYLLCVMGLTVYDDFQPESNIKFLYIFRRF